MLRRIKRSRYFVPALLAVAFVPAAVLVYLQYRSLEQTQGHMNQMRLAYLRQALAGARVEAQTDFRRWPRQALLGPEVHEWLRQSDTVRMNVVANGAVRICPHLTLAFGYRKIGAAEDVFVFRRSRVQHSMEFSRNDPLQDELRRLLAVIPDRRTHFVQLFVPLNGEPHQLFLHLVDDDPTGSTIPHVGKIGFYGFAVPARMLATDYLAPLLRRHLAKLAGTENELAESHGIGGVFNEKSALLASSRPGVDTRYSLEETLGAPSAGLVPGWTIRAGLSSAEVSRFDRAQYTEGLAVIAVLTAFFAVTLVLLALAATREMELSRAKTEFVASVSHELKTPLSLIRGFVETLQLNRVSGSAQRQEYFRIIEAEILRLSDLIDRILDLSKIEVGLKSYEPEPLDLTVLIEDSLNQFSNELERGQFTVNCKIEAPLPLTRVDPQAFSRAFLNLMSNAVKYSDTERQITVSAGEKNGKLEVAVTDQGIGIPVPDQSRIFDSFYRTRQTAKKAGAGLGLALVKHFAIAHGGEVMVSSALGKGSTFAIILPLHTAG